MPTPTGLQRLLNSRVAVLAVGLLVGAASARLPAIGAGGDVSPQVPPVESALPAAEPQPRTAALTIVPAPESRGEPAQPAPSTVAGAEPVRPPTSAGEDATAQLVAVTTALRESLARETSARMLLESELEQLRTALVEIDRDVDLLTSKQRESERRTRRWRDRPRVDARTLVEAGYSQTQAAQLANRWGEQEMAELYLRDEARREGWIRTEQYTAALADLRKGPDSMRSTLGDDEYDTFLYSIGQSNRILVESVIASSPAQAVGLREGDIIRGYDGTRIFSQSDLRSAIAADDPGLPVSIQIERDGDTIDVEIPRGPLGVRLGRETMAP